MTEGMSLRERKKLQTRHRLLAAATELFAERGFDKVSVAEIAEAADVSKMTVFNYFSGKEDLVLAPMEQHVGDVARAVRNRAPANPPWRPCTGSSWPGSRTATPRSE